MAIDPQKLRLHVFEKTGIKVDVDDPIFALVALNEAVLEDAVERHLARLDAASAELAELIRSAGGLPPAPAASAAYTPTPASGATVRPIATAHETFSRRELRLLGAAAGVAVLTAVLVLAGQALFSKPAVSPARLEKALSVLDAKSRAAVEAELNR